MQRTRHQRAYGGHGGRQSAKYGHNNIWTPYALLQEACKTFGLLAQRRTLVRTMGCNGFVMVSGQAALRTLAPLVPYVVETTQERANIHLKSAAAPISD